KIDGIAQTVDNGAVTARPDGRAAVLAARLKPEGDGVPHSVAAPVKLELDVGDKHFAVKAVMTVGASDYEQLRGELRDIAKTPLAWAHAPGVKRPRPRADIESGPNVLTDAATKLADIELVGLWDTSE